MGLICVVLGYALQSPKRIMESWAKCATVDIMGIIGHVEDGHRVRGGGYSIAPYYVDHSPHRIPAKSGTSESGQSKFTCYRSCANCILQLGCRSRSPGLRRRHCLVHSRFYLLKITPDFRMVLSLNPASMAMIVMIYVPVMQGLCNSITV